MKFRCDCLTHILKIEDFSDRDLKGLSIQIYDVHSPKDRKYKKPKLIADVAIMDNHYPKEYTKLIKFMEKLGRKYVR